MGHEKGRTTSRATDPERQEYPQQNSEGSGLPTSPLASHAVIPLVGPTSDHPVLNVEVGLAAVVYGLWDVGRGGRGACGVEG